MDLVVVHPRVHERHPDLSDADVPCAWRNCIRARQRLNRSPNECIAIGVNERGRLIEMVAFCSPDGDWLIYHAMTPPTKKTLVELGLAGGSNG